MDLTPKQYIDRFERVIEKVKGNRDGTIMARLAAQANTMIEQRVINTGTDAKGKGFKPYSTKPMLIGCSSFKTSVCKQIFGSKAKRRALDWRTVGGSTGYAAYLSVSSGAPGGNKGKRLAILPGGYKKWRELMLGPGKGDKVDFSVTNRMWNNITVISSTANHKAGLAIIGAKDEPEKKKLAGNTKRKGDILDLSQKEQDELKADFNLQVLNIFRENGL